MMSHRVSMLIAAMLLPAPLSAADPPRVAIADEHRLSDVEVQKILDAAALNHEKAGAPAALAEPTTPSARSAEGEMGVAIGTGGYREAFGTAILPLGANGTAIISFDTVDSSRGRGRRHR